MLFLYKSLTYHNDFGASVHMRSGLLAHVSPSRRHRCWIQDQSVFTRVSYIDRIDIGIIGQNCTTLTNQGIFRFRRFSYETIEFYLVVSFVTQVMLTADFSTTATFFSVPTSIDWIPVANTCIMVYNVHDTSYVRDRQSNIVSSVLRIGAKRAQISELVFISQAEYKEYFVHSYEAFIVKRQTVLCTPNSYILIEGFTMANDWLQCRCTHFG